MADKQLRLNIVADSTKARKALAKLDGSLEKTESTTAKMGRNLKTALAGAGLGALIFGSLSDADESLKIAHQTEAAIKSTGGAARVSAQEIGDLATAISNKTGIDDEAIQSGENMLLTFKNIRNEAGKGNDIFTQTAKITLDMATAMGTDMQQAAVQLGKALNDPTRNLTALSRVGIQFNDQQTQQIKTMQKSGDIMGAQKIILKELTSEFGGSAEAQASSLDKIKTQVGNASESLGTALMPAVALVSSGVSMITGAFSGLPPYVQSSAVAVGGLAIAWARWGDAIKAIQFKGVLDDFRLGLMGVADASGGLSSKIGMVIRKAGPYVLAAGAMGKASSVWLDKVQKGALDVDRLTTALGHFVRTGKVAGELKNAGGIEGIAKDIAKLRSESRGLNGVANSVVGTVFKIVTVGQGGDTGLEKLTARVKSYDDTLAGMVKAGHGKEAAALVKELTAAAKEQGMTSSQVLGQLDAYTGAVEDAKIKNADATPKFSLAAAALKDQKEKTKAAKDAMEAMTRAIQAYADKTTGLLQSNINVQSSLSDLAQSLKDNGTNFDINTEKGRNNMNAILGINSAMLGTISTMSEQGASVDQITGKWSGMVDQLRATMIQSGMSKDEVNKLLWSLGMMPSQVRTDIVGNLPTAKRQAQQLLDTLNSMPTEKRIAVTMAMYGAGSIFGSDPRNPTPSGHAWGGRLGGGWSWVGEHGPELTNGRMVIGAGRAQALADRLPPVTSNVGGATVIYNVTVNVAGSVRADRELAATLRDELLRDQARSSSPLLPGVGR